MLAKFETKSSRVKGVSFHPTRPWILCSLHDGQIQLWDYRVGTLLETFNEHDGPVRSVDFHPTQPLFVSGGDDYKIRVWNYNNKRSLFTLMGHLDYIRTVQFHPENPWIVSCSDDQNIRIWNWQSRECIAVLTGHNHYVMSAQFHPKEDLVVSASLDQTIRVWDISGLKNKGKSMGPKNGTPSAVIGRLGTDLVGTVKYVLEGHERGVNWASFHPELPLIVSGSDDRMIKIWRTNETRAWEVDTLRGHTNNVSCVMFHPREDLILSNSEDHSIRVWDSTKRVGIQSFVRSHDRFWIITAHKTQNLLAAGHDSGTVVFKLRRERVPFACHGKVCFFVKDRYYHYSPLDGSSPDGIIMPIVNGPATSTNFTRILQSNPYSKDTVSLLMFSKENDGMYELLTFPTTLPISKPQHIISGDAISVTFLSRTKFVTLDKNNSIYLRNLDNNVTKRITLPLPSCTTLFNGGSSGYLLIYNDSSLSLFDTSSQQVLGTLTIDGVKRVIWNATSTYCAILTAFSIRIVDRTMKQVAVITEKMRVKDALWDEHGILLYSTLSQIKYMLISGENGIVRSLDTPVYIISYHAGIMYAFDRNNKLIHFEVDPSEFLFKYYLEQHQYRNALRIIRQCHLDSKAIIGYLQRSGYEDIALYFVNEPRARFNLAIRCGNLNIAMECAMQLDETTVWNELAKEALQQGNYSIVETCYQRTKSFEKLSFLYVITGNHENLKKMMKIASIRNDQMSRFYNAMYLGDVDTRIEVLLDVGQITLAYITATVYKKEEWIEKIQKMMEEQKIPIPSVDAPEHLLTPPEPVNPNQDWSYLEMPRSTVDRVMEEEIAGTNEPVEETTEPDFHSIDEENEEEEEENKNQWGDDDLDFNEGGNGWGDDLDLSDDDDDEVGMNTTSTVMDYSVPKPGSSITYWCDNSSLIYDQACSGNIDTTCQLLHRQIGIVHYTPFFNFIRGCYLSVQPAIVGYPSMPSLPSPFTRSSKPSLPAMIYTKTHILHFLKMGLRYFQNGNFEESLNVFRSMFLLIPFVIAQTAEEEMFIKQSIDTIREYITAIMLELRSKECGENIQQSLEYTYFMTRCHLQNQHLLLVLNSAMVASFKIKNFIDAAAFANQILANPDVHNNPSANAGLVTKAKKVLARCEKDGRNAGPSCIIDRPFLIDLLSFTPVYKEENCVTCPYCSASYKEEANGKVCAVCGVAQIGLKTLGLVCRKQ